MNIKITTFTLSIISVIGLSQAAQAQESNPNRWHFAANTWKQESGNVPRYGAPPATIGSVRSGAVPHNMLGVDPMFLHHDAPPQQQLAVAPIARTATSATPSFTTAVPTVVPNNIPAQFRAIFGKPLEVVAHNPRRQLL